ncbi:response regulator [Frigoriglobus tundricola]|uniref:response regulator n=1 Tax=Frigoriglobus tundricola TaxID=2774151 RepID=UPI00148EABE0|nr:response regulator [Frigoriglobus tundricola]
MPRPRGVLVIDDNDDIRSLLGAIVRTQGFLVWLASGGFEGETLYRNYGPEIDLVLLDVQMPDRDGPATLAAIRALAPAVPCCFISGHTGEYTEDQLLGFGAAAVLRKPFRLSELIDHLRQLTGPAGACGHTNECRSARAAGSVSEYTEEQ